MDAAEPAVERDEGAAVGLAVEHGAAAVGEHDLVRREAVAPGERRRRSEGVARRRLDEPVLARPEIGEARPHPRVAEERRLLGALGGDEDLERRPAAVADRLERLALGAAQAVPGRGQLLEVAAQRRAEVRQRRRVRGQQRFDRLRPGRADRLPGELRERDLVAAHRRAAGPEGAELGGLHLAEEAVGEDRLDRVGAAVDGVEDLDELQLVVEVVLEPDHDDLVAGERGAQARVAGAHVGLDRVRVAPAAGGEEPGAHGAKLVGVEVGGHRPLVQGVAPRDHVAADAGGLDARHRGVAVRDVEHQGSCSVR